MYVYIHLVLTLSITDAQFAQQFPILHILCVFSSQLSLGDSGELEVFSFMKQLVHRVGVTCWVGREAGKMTRPPFIITVHGYS